MALETKAIIQGMANFAAAVKSKVMYNYAVSLASTEGFAMKSYEEAKQELASDQADDNE